MSTYLAEKYSDLLSSEDILRLFRRLEESSGSVSEAARASKLQRKTIYLWKEKGYMKPQTKRKVVEALLEAEPDETLSYMTKRSIDNATEILAATLSSIYEKAILAPGKEEFLELAHLFDRIKVEYSGLITDKLLQEVSGLVYQLAHNANERGITWTPAPLMTLRINQLETAIPMIVKEIQIRGESRVSEIASQFSLPETLVTSIRGAMKETTIRWPTPQHLTLQIKGLFRAPRLEGWREFVEPSPSVQGRWRTLVNIDISNAAESLSPPLQTSSHAFQTAAVPAESEVTVRPPMLEEQLPAPLAVTTGST